MKKIIFLIISMLPWIIPLPVYAQQPVYSNKVITQFGNPIGPPPIASTTTNNNSQALPVLEWDQKIVSNLELGANGLYSKLSVNISNSSYSTGTWSGFNDATVYWCTYSIVDSYNLAGNKGLSKTAHAAVVEMHKFWMSNPTYKFLDYPSNNTLLKSAQPGYAIFMERSLLQHTGGEHVAMLKTISLDQRGNGYIDTSDSNSPSRTNHYPVVEWSIKNTTYPVRGVGGI